MQDGELSVEEVVSSFYELQQQKKLDDKAFNDEKQEFTKRMDEAFSSKKLSGSSSFTVVVGYDDENGTRATGGEYKVTKVSRRKVVFNAKKLKNKIGKEKFNKVSETQWNCFDIGGLARYVKSLGGEFDVFKSFFNVTQVVDDKAIDKLSETGEITAEDIEGCYSVNESKPWYKVSFKAAEDDEE